MDRSTDFFLLAAERTQDAIGQWKSTIVKRPVFGQIQSVSGAEFFAAGQNGISPEYRITMFGPDYDGEQDLELDGVVYSVYRTYRGKNDTIELYVERRRGDA